MLFTGQKIIVLVSSNSKTGAKIRRGSLGYISSFGTSRVNYKSNFILIPAKIIFTRFGYEKKHRIESKIVYLLYPIESSINIKYIRKYLITKIKVAKSMTPLLKQDLLNEGVKLNKLDIIVVNKTNEKVNILTDKNEFSAWFSSVIQSGIFHKLYKIEGNNEFKKVKLDLLTNINNEIFDLKKCLQYNGETIKQAKNIYKNKEVQLNIIKQFKTYLHLDIKRIIDELKLKEKLKNSFWNPHFEYESIWTICNNNIIIEKEITTLKTYRGSAALVTNWISQLNILANTK